MFLIRRIHDADLPANQTAIASVQQLLRDRFAALNEGEIAQLPDKLSNPFLQRFSAVLYVAERPRLHDIEGFALVLREPNLRFHYLDFIAADVKSWGGIGAALYERVRRDARATGMKGLFFECLPDEAGACADPAVTRENRARLRFYERWGARPIIGTEYEKPVRPGDDCMPHLVCDTLGSEHALKKSHVRAVVRAVLERKYSHLCPPAYVEAVVSSIKQDPVELRPPRYANHERKPNAKPNGKTNGKHDAKQEGKHEGKERVLAAYPIVVNEKHDIHHVKERGYVEAPVRVRSILAGLETAGSFRRVPAKSHGLDPITQVHDADFVTYLQRACASVPEGKSIYPYVFPIRNAAKQPQDLAVRAGYYCIDTFTPLNKNAFLAARGAVDCALTAAECVVEGERLAYALVRPPGHHAERRSYGGFCYFNNAAIAANHLSRIGRVAILDIDYHHGNGQQDIFYERTDVLTVSIHGHPNFAYPYFSGFDDEVGRAEGEGYNLNITLPERSDGVRYRKALARALERVVQYDPSFLVVALGFDTAKGDPTGSWSLGYDDFERNGALIGALDLPTLVVQEGGYQSKSLGPCATHFFRGLTTAIAAS